jgi:hypothetical protein
MLDRTFDLRWPNRRYGAITDRRIHVQTELIFGIDGSEMTMHRDGSPRLGVRLDVIRPAAGSTAVTSALSQLVPPTSDLAIATKLKYPDDTEVHKVVIYGELGSRLITHYGGGISRPWLPPIMRNLFLTYRQDILAAIAAADFTALSVAIHRRSWISDSVVRDHSAGSAHSYDRLVWRLLGGRPTTPLKEPWEQPPRD